MTDDILQARRRRLEDTIRHAAKELLAISDFDGFSFPFGDGREIRLGVEVKPQILFDDQKACVVVDGRECYTGDELWEVAWAAERNSRK